MALPIIETPRYELTLPSSDVQVQFRPFIVKEEKILLVAMESKDNNEIINATKNILRACTFEALDIDTLPMFDIEYLLLQIRGKSVGEVAKFKVICPDDKQTATDVELDLSTINVQVDDDHTNKVVIDEKRELGLVLNYPSLGITKAGFDVNKENVDTMFKVVANCIDHIYEGEKTYPAKDSTQKELITFLEGLSQEAFLKIKKFFDTMPQLRQEVEVTNPKTGIVSKVTFKGLQDFFQ
jgi:copper chaperone CopZ